MEKIRYRILLGWDNMFTISCLFYPSCSGSIIVYNIARGKIEDMKWSRKILVAIYMISIMTVAVILYIFVFPKKNKQSLTESLFCNRTDIVYSDDVRIVTDKNTYQSDDVISFYLINISEELYTYGREFVIEMLNNNWNYVLPDGVMQMFELDLFILKPNSKSEGYSIDLKKEYSHLQSGTYRIYKEVTDVNDNSYMIYTEFQME